MRKKILLLVALNLFLSQFLLSKDVLQEYYKQAQEALKNKNLIKAENLFQYLISQDPENSIYHVGLAETYKLKGEFEHAIVEYKRALELKKEKDLSIMNNIATLYKWIRKYKESASWLNKILEIDPAHKESLQDMENLRLRRGLHFEINSGGWEVDYTKKGYDMRLFVGKIDWIDIYIGYSKAERIFYEREELFAKFYFFPKYTTYLKLEFQDKNYDYPNNPDPDSTSYDHTPGIEIEVSHIINSKYKLSILYKFFNPNFYWDEFMRAYNHKIEGRFSSKWFDLLETEVFFALLRDPDSATFTVNKNLRKVARFDYKTRFLLGGNIQISTETFETEIKYIPNRDLDDSLSYSFFFNIEKEIINKSISFPVIIRMDYIYDKYSQYSYLSGKSSKVYMFTLIGEPFSFLRLKFGGKFLIRPQRNEFGFFIGLVYKLKL